MYNQINNVDFYIKMIYIYIYYKSFRVQMFGIVCINISIVEYYVKLFKNNYIIENGFV